MRNLRTWLLLTALIVSANLLFGDSTTWRAIVCDIGTYEIYPIDLPLNQPPSAESPLAGIPHPYFVAITGDATRAIVTNIQSPPEESNIFSLDLTTDHISIATSTHLENGATALAITPDGAKIYVVNVNGDIQVLNTNNLSSITTIPNGEFYGASLGYIALSPTRPEGYVSVYDAKVYVINTLSNTVTGSYDLPVGVSSAGIAVTPNGAEVYVGSVNNNQIFSITLSDGTVHTINGKTSSTTTNIVIAPDGMAVYAIQASTPDTVLTKIDTSTHAVVAEFPIPSALGAPAVAAITPDGKTVCITDGTGPGQYVAFIDTATGSSSTLQLTISESSGCFGIAITPDQAPTARFTYSASGSCVTFDASASSSPIGGISTYAWNFGDGQTLTTSSPITSHTYSASGTFTVTLTVTNTGGTSTELAFTGQTASNNGGPSAVTTQQILVQTMGVAKFTGQVRRGHHDKRVFLSTRWSRSLIPHTKKFTIFARNTKVATVKANHKHKKKIRLHPHRVPKSISKQYRRYLGHKYNIRVVDAQGHISQPTFLRVAQH